jgi:hypothetical protein
MSYEFERISYAEMISNARESLDFGTKEEIEELELEEYFSFSDDNLDYDFENDEHEFDTNTIESTEFFDGESFNFDLYDDYEDDYDDEEIF